MINVLTFYDGFFLNLCVLIASLFVYKEIIKKSSIEKQTIITDIIQGLLGGLLAAILMRFSINTGVNSMIDLRIVPFMLVIIYGNWVSASITAGLIIATRFMMGISTYAFTNIIFVLLSWIIFCYGFKLIKRQWTAIIVTLSLSNIVYTVLSTLFRVTQYRNIPLIINYWIICILGGLIAVYIMDHLNKSEVVFKENRNFAFTDSLTGLNNVRSFDIAFNKAKKRLENNEGSLSIMILDIDRFKQVNDTYGHLEGDAVLRKLGSILKMSQGPKEVISRIGGEEFSILLIDCSLDEARKRAESLRKIVENSFFLIKNATMSLHITISVGVTTYETTTKNIDELYDHADQALYLAKKSGRNKVCSYEEVINLRMNEKIL